MKHSIISISISLVCMLMVSLTALTVMATGNDNDDEQSNSSVVSSSESSSDTSSETGSDETSSDEGTTSDGLSSDETSSDEMSSDETSSNSSTTSKPGQSSAKPGGGSTFIPETGSDVTISTPTIDVEEGDEEQLYVEDEEAEGVDEEIDEYEGGKVIAMSSLVYRFIWIPITTSILCIAALIYVNMVYRLKTVNDAAPSKSRSGRKPAKKGARRRNVK